MKRVLIIAFYFPPQGGIASLRVLRFLRHLRSQGWAADVLTAAPGPNQVTDPELMRDIPGETRIFRERSEKESSEAGPSPALQTLGRTRPGLKPGGFLKVAAQAVKDWLPSVAEPTGWRRTATRVGLELVRREEYDCLYSTSGPLGSHEAAASLAQSTGIPWVAEFRDAVTDNPFLRFPTPWHRHRAGARESRIVREAHTVVVTTRTHAELLRRRHGDTIRVVVIPNGFEPSEYGDEVRSDSGRFVMIHAGSFYGARSFLPFLMGWKEWLNHLPSAGRPPLLRFFGEAFNLDVRAVLREHRLEDSVEILGVRPHREVMVALRGADAALVIKSPDDRVHVPGKLYECLGAGRPILLMAPQSEATDLLDRLGAGVWIDGLDPMGIADGLRRIVSAAGASESGIAEYRADAITARLARCLSEAAGARRAVPAPAHGIPLGKERPLRAD